MARLGLLLLKYFTPFLLFNYCTAKVTKEMKIHMLPVYAMLAEADFLNSTQCGKELTDLREAIDQQLLWSLKVIDASGVPKSGFIYGNNYWLGSRSQCEDAKNRNPLILLGDELRNNSKYRRIGYEFPPYEVKYSVANFRLNSTSQYHIGIPNEDLIILGMCLPASCSKDQLSVLIETMLKNRTLFQTELYLSDLKLVEIRDLIDDYQWLFSGTFITITIIVVLTLLLMTIGTAYDVLIYQERSRKYNTDVRDSEIINMLATNNTQAIRENNENQLEKFKYPSFLFKIFQAFSVYSNTKIIFSKTTETFSIPAIHGLRFLSMVWTIMMHTYFFPLEFFDNKLMFWRKSEKIFNQMMTNGSLSIDTFFCFGGFLIAYRYLKINIISDKRKTYNYLNTIKLYFFALLKRFMRLTPPCMIIIGSWQIIETWLSKTSQFYLGLDRSHENCPKYWWRNILYIQNLFGVQDMCMIWSWYLPNDMQFFAITTFLLFLSSIYFKVAASLLVLLLASSIILRGYIAYIYDFVTYIDRQYILFDVLYFQPWVRIGPYLVGVITAYIVIKLNNKLVWKKVKKHPNHFKFFMKTILLLWILGSLCNILVLYGLYQKGLSVFASVLYAALGRTVWAIGIAWIIIACSTDNGGIVNRILSLKVWIPFSRLTYIAYLINPFIIISLNLSRETSPHLDDVVNFTSGLGYVVLSYICSYVISLMFEMPYLNLTKEGFNYLNIK